MRRAPNVRLEQIRVAGKPGANYGDFRHGPFFLRVAAGHGWDHVSVSRRDRCPTWDEMDRIKRLVFRDEEVVMQVHVNDGQKVNLHPYCLHLWRPQTAEEIAAERAAWEADGEAWPYGDLDPAPPIPLPPVEMV